MTVILRGDRGAFGAALTPPQTGPLRLGTLAAAGVGVPRLAIDAEGNVTAGVLGAGDLPSVFPPGGALAPPAATSRSLGTRLVLEAVAGSTEYAIGRDSGVLWTSVPLTVAHKWYHGATERLRLDADGTLNVVNGSGVLHLTAAVGGSGHIVTPGALTMTAGSVLQVSTAGREVLPLEGYRENFGSLPRKWATVHAGELWVESLVAQNTIATIGGRIFVGPTSTLTRDVLPADAAIYVKHNAFGLHVAAVEYGSKLILQSAGRFEVMRVASSTVPAPEPEGDYRYSVERNVDGVGVADVWHAGDAVVDTGKATVGPGAFIDMYSMNALKYSSSTGPTIVGNVRTGQGALDWREHWAIGNLQYTYGNDVRTFGAAFGDTNGMHLQVDATDGITFHGGPGKSGALFGRWSMTGVITLGTGDKSQIQINPTDGTFRLRYNGVDKILLQSDGNAYLNGGLILGAFGGTYPYIKSVNANNWNDGRGFFFFHDTPGNISTALIGNSTGRRLQWNGASLILVSDGLTIDENGITVLQNSGTAATPGRLIRFGTTGGYLFDTTTGLGGVPEFYIIRPAGNIQIQAQGGNLILGSKVGADQSYITLSPTNIEINGGASGLYPPFRAAVDYAFDLGTTTRRWLNVHAYRIGLGIAPTAYHIQLGTDAAAKPGTSTWYVPTVTNLRATRDVETVSPRAALAVIEQVPVVRHRARDGSDPVIGIVPEDVRALLPLSITDRADGVIDWNAHELFMLTVAAVQAVAARLDALERNADR